jgi:hypothetical protein
MDVRDNTNITGIYDLLNYTGNKDLKELERSIIDDTTASDKVDDVEEYRRQLEEYGNALGVSLQADDEDEDDNDDASGENDTESIDDVHQYRDKKVGFNSRYESEEIDTMFNRVPAYRPKPESYGARITEEQKKQKILNHVLDGIEDQKFSVEKEKEEDDKAIMLEQIDMLMTNLKDEGIDVSRVPVVDTHSPVEDIASVHKILRLKNDRNRYCSFAEECILAGSHTLEWMFDGEKTYMGRRPDLRGWSATVNIKLRRMKYETSTFVSGVMQDYNLGPGTRIALELIPSLFLYSKMRKSQHSDNLITSDEMNAALDTIRDIEEGTNDF